MKDKIGKLKDKVLSDFISYSSSNFRYQFRNDEDYDTSTIYHSVSSSINNSGTNLLEVADEPYRYIEIPVRKGFILHRTITVHTDIFFLAY